MWWPMQDYFNLITPRDATIPFDETYSCRGALGFLRLFKGSDYSRVCSALLDPQIRAGLVDIWLNRDYTRYAQATGRSDLTLSTWQPADQMRLYVQKDVAAKIWNYGVGPAQTVAEEDPTEGKVFVYEADAVLDASQANPVTLNYPRSMAFARDGSFYVADSLNHRILHLNPDGTLLQEWGSLGQSTDETPAPLGTFNEPWGVAVGHGQASLGLGHIRTGRNPAFALRSARHRRGQQGPRLRGRHGQQTSGCVRFGRDTHHANRLGRL
jgi:hypothetical protein